MPRIDVQQVHIQISTSIQLETDQSLMQVIGTKSFAVIAINVFE